MGVIDISDNIAYKKAIDFLQTAASPGSTLELSVIECLLEELGNPHHSLKYVHVAGTNGKGSTCAFISSILRSAGYKTGLFISPIIQEFSEQIQVNGNMITNDEIIALTNDIAIAVDRVLARNYRRPSFFELVTAIAFMHFKNQACDIVVLETGLGGRLDATNVIPASEVSAITNIGLDHTEFLGDTLELIAREKAGIIKDGCTVVLYAQSMEVENVIAKHCLEHSVPLRIANGKLADLIEISPEGSTFSYGKYDNVEIKLAGLYQVNNSVMAITIAEALNDRGYEIVESAIRDGLKRAYWPGRFEMLKNAPFVFVDGAHNPQCAEALMQSLNRIFPNRKITFVFGILADKDYKSIIKLSLPLAKRYYTISPPSDRALSSTDLCDEIRSGTQLPVSAYKSIPEALEQVMEDASMEDIICIFGSLYQVGEIRKFFGRTKF